MEERERDNWIPRTPGHLLRELRRGCPQLFVDESAPAERRIVITDDFGQRVEMSADQFGSLVEEAQAGHLDAAVTA
ncbi:hypothetical protein EES45_34165 [Streptomyces sp. ADI97-07]|nr:hypothetical protein EES45_34165 [Streptomyces sp. ADI97-07]GHB28156.1 hypothetical protein GCM10010392_65410 [Streptomyces clavifer]